MNCRKEKEVSLREIAANAVRKVFAALLLVLSGFHCAAAQFRVPPAQAIETVSFCDLIRHPDEYSGKTVRVAGRLGAGPEGAAFSDSACDKSETGRQTLTADAKFSGYDEGAVQAWKKIDKFLKKHRTFEAQVTVIALFSHLEHPEPLLEESSYRLDVKQVLAVKRISQAPNARP
jgi:hypothetical protein